ncbi:MAG: poly(hydroxyalkanoate) granule-associated protein [Burkholderiaceae bacterium]|nr:MAG: poly(hydroxyalkanoate) granule-associated protein [Burkholderiaceae bacterium]
MATRPRKTAAAAAPATPDAPAPSPLQTPHNIWLAGLGALAGAQASAQTEGSKAFEGLVQQGLDWQARTQALAKEKWAEAAERMGAMTAQATGGVGSWDKLGGIFEDRVARALASMGMPSASEVAQLKARVEALEAALAALQGTASVSPARKRGTNGQVSAPTRARARPGQG